RASQPSSIASFISSSHRSVPLVHTTPKFKNPSCVSPSLLSWPQAPSPLPSLSVKLSLPPQEASHRSQPVVSQASPVAFHSPLVVSPVDLVLPVPFPDSPVVSPRPLAASPTSLASPLPPEAQEAQAVSLGHLRCHRGPLDFPALPHPRLRYW
ncbi:hypothetical protein T440DRAFT_558341, partial [Plenodomus tracheiphilus IPT5]